MKVPPMTPELPIEELRRLERDATPGTVLLERREDDDGSIDWIAYSPTGDFAACFETANENARANAHLLVAMRNALPSLLSALEDSRRMLEEERGKLAEIRGRLEAWAGKADIGTGLLREIHDLTGHSPGCEFDQAHGYECTCLEHELREADEHARELAAARERILELEDRCADLAERCGLRP